jgi:cytochrome c-type biogenesis protein CcmH/NrfG
MKEPGEDFKEIEDFLKKQQIKKTPPELLDKFSKEVMDRIQTEQPGSPWGLGIPGAVCVILLLAVGLFMWGSYQHKAPEEKIQLPKPTAAVIPVEASSPAVAAVPVEVPQPVEISQPVNVPQDQELSVEETIQILEELDEEGLFSLMEEVMGEEFLIQELLITVPMT